MRVDDSIAAMTVPRWQLALRFGLELAALAALGVCGYDFVGIVAAIGLPVVAATLWGTFAVANEPYRAPNPPVPVAGPVRLAIEAAVFVGALVALAFDARWIWFGVFAALLVVHHVGTRERLAWVFNASRASRR
jgi:hypothetical protein